MWGVRLQERLEGNDLVNGVGACVKGNYTLGKKRGPQTLIRIS